MNEMPTTDKGDTNDTPKGKGRRPRPGRDRSNTHAITLRFPPDVLEEFRDLAARLNMELTPALIHAMKRYIRFPPSSPRPEEPPTEPYPPDDDTPIPPRRKPGRKPRPKTET